MPPGPKQTVLRNLVRIRFDDAEALLRTNVPQRRNGAMYMAGYGVECALKARICDERGEQRLDPEFSHGRRGHDLAWLAENTNRWSGLPGGDPHRDILRDLQGQWDVAMRYTSPYRDPSAVRKFIEKAKDFTTWLLRN
jgi:hypothetical protein